MGEEINIYISLSASYSGNACSIRQSIINYTKNPGKTQIFDWLVTSLKSVNEILSGKPIYFDTDSIYPNPLNKISIKFKNFDLLVSHHDLEEFNNNSLNELIKKYIRRYERFITTIKSQNKINFIRYCKNQEDLEEEEIIKFYKNINILNPFLVFNFVLTSDYDNLIIPNNLLKYNIFYINLNNYKTSEEYLNNVNLTNVELYKCIFDMI